MMTLWSVAVASGAGLVFAASFASKVRSADAWRSYRESIRLSGTVPKEAAILFAGALALAEVITVGLLAVPASRGFGIAAALVLSLSLTAGVGIAIARHSQAVCQCFGAGERLSAVHLARNLMLTVVAGTGLAAWCAPVTETDWENTVVGGLIGVGLAVIIVGWEDLVWAMTALRGQVQP